MYYDYNFYSFLWIFDRGINKNIVIITFLNYVDLDWRPNWHWIPILKSIKELRPSGLDS